jgi:subtilisin-like proprotein convertase family protein
MLATLGALGTTLAYRTVAQATVPTTTQVELLLLTAGGGPAADGDYAVKVALYSSEAGGKAVWSEGPGTVAVKSGLASWALGAQSPLAPALAGGQAAWLEVQVLPDPPLPRRPVGAGLFSQRAGVAEAVDCSGCIGGAQLDPKLLADYAKISALAKVATSGQYGDLQGVPNLADYAKSAALAKVASSGQYADLQGAPNLAGYPKTAELANVAFTGKYADLQGGPDLAPYAQKTDLAAVALSGKYADLEGAPKLGVACGTGLVVKGLKSDGSLDCTSGGGTLPADGLATVSNGTLSNQFTDTFTGPAAPIAIPDNNPVGASDSLLLPDLGVVNSLKVSIDIANSDLSSLTVKLFDPNGAAYVLFDKGKVGNALTASYPAPDKPVSGDLGAWVGKNPKGKWSLSVIDLGFLNNKTDGLLKSWSIQAGSLSANKVAAEGRLLTKAGLQLQNADKDPVACAPDTYGFVYYNTTSSSVVVCTAQGFVAIALTPALGSAANPATSCKALLVQHPSTKSGTYWLKPGAKAFQAYCDMTTGGGGWTMCYSTDGEVHIKSEISSNTPYGTSGYRSDCNDIAFSEVLYVNHTGSQSAWFAREGGGALKLSATNYNTAGSDFGQWAAAGGVASANFKYQLNICDAGWMWAGLMMTGFNGCWKQCGSWCSDTQSPYFRVDGDDGNAYNGVAFNENGHQNVGGKLMSAGIR